MLNTIKHISILVVFFYAITFVSQASYAVEAETVYISYFYTNICESCREADETIDYYKDLLRNKKDSVNIVIISYNIAESNGLFAYREHLNNYNIDKEKIDVPVLFAGDRYFVGPEEVEKGLRDIAADGIKYPGYYVYLKADDSIVKKDYSAFRLSGAAITGFLNGLNTCALSMLLFLISLLLVKPDIKVGKVGAAFIVGKFLAYFFIGSLFYSLFSSIDINVYSFFMKVFLSLFAVSMAFLNLWDFLKARNEKYGKIKNQLPGSLRKLNHHIISKAFDKRSGTFLFITSAFIGIVVSIGEFVCTGQLYIATIAYILQTGTDGMTPYIFLAIYSFSFIIPASIVLFIISRTRKILSMSEFFRKIMPEVKLATGILLLIAAGLPFFIL